MSGKKNNNSFIQRVSEVCKQSLKLFPKIWINFQIYVARFLNNLAGLYESQGKYSKAESLYEKSLAIYKQVFGEFNTDVATSLNNLAGLYESQGRYDEAEPLYEKSLELRKQLLGEFDSDVASSLNNLAYLYKSQARYDKAEDLFYQSLQLRKQLFGEVHNHIANSLNNLGHLYYLQGKYNEAEPLYLRSFEIHKQLLGELHPHVATSLNNLAILYESQGRYSEAEPLFQESLELRKQLLGELHPHVATSLNNLAGLYESQGRYSKAEPLYEKSLELTKQIFGEVHPHIPTSLNNLAKFYYLQGRYSKAEPLYEKSLELTKQIFGEFDSDVASSLNNLAMLYKSQGIYDEAEPLFQKSLELRKQIFGDVHPHIASSLNNLAGLYFSQNKYDEAEPLFQKSLELRKQLLGEVHPDVATGLNNLAVLYKSQGRYNQAEPLYEQSLEVSNKVLGEVHPHIIVTLISLAILYTNTNRPQQALEKLQEAIEIEHRLMNQEFVGSSEDDRIRFLDKIRTTQYTLLSLIYKYYYHLEESEEKSKAIHIALDVLIKRKALSNAASAAINAAIYRNRDSEDIQENIQNAFKTLCSLQTQINNLRTSLYLPENLPRLSANKKLLQQLQEKVQELDKYITRQVPEIGFDKQLVNLEDIALELPENSSLIEFVYFPVYDFENNQWGNPRYLAFILPGQQPDKVQMFDLGEAEKIDKLIKIVRNVVTKNLDNLLAVVSKKWKPKIPNLHQITELSNSIFKPLQNHLQAEELFICADGGLTLIPFGILPLDTESNQLIIDKYNITYLNASRDLLRYQYQVKRSAAKSLVIANPNFDLSVENAVTTFEKNDLHEEDAERKDSSINRDSIANEIKENQGFQTLGKEDKKASKPFSPVPMTAKIAKVVANQFQVEPLLENRALKSYLTNGKCPEKLVLATHAFFLPQKLKTPSINRVFGESLRFEQIETTENPLFRSGLALAGANTWLLGGKIPTEAEEGIVFAQDVAGLDLWINKIIILIACETAVGDAIAGEGVKGLRSAFIAAGARLIIMSMWSVDANVSILLMNRFFENMDVRKLPTQLALKEAQNYIRTITRKELASLAIGQEILNSLQKYMPERDEKWEKSEYPLEHRSFWGAWVCLGRDFPR